MRERLKNSVIQGVGRGLRTGWWISKMMIPITLLVALLKWAGVITVLSDWLSPAFSYIGLGGEAVVVFLTNALSPLYSGIALIATMNIDYRSATILAVMGLICHNLIVETIIQRRAGANGAFIVVLRVGVALLAGVGLNFMLPATYSGRLIIESATAATTFGGIMNQWGMGMLKLVPIMFVLIVGLNVLQQVLREFRLIDYLTIPVQPVVKFLGLPRESSFLWIVLNTLGLAYGGAVLIGEIDSREISPTTARLLNTHVAITHSLLEDTLIFVAIGLSAFWMIVPRVILSFIAVWGERFYNRLHNTQPRAVGEDRYNI